MVQFNRNILYTSIAFLFLVLYPLSLFGQTVRSLAKIQKTDTTYIMPLGDSITKGHTGSSSYYGYRYALYNYLLAGYPSYIFKFVGFNHGFTTNDWDYFEAYQGWQAIETRSDTDYNRWDMLSHLKSDYDTSSNNIRWGELNTKLTRYNPNIVLLHVGTNDLHFGGYTPSEVANNVDSVLNTIYSLAYNSNASSTVVFLAKIILDDSDNLGVNGPDATRTKNYNKDLLSRAVNRIVNNSDKLIVVNMQDALIYPDSLAILPSDTGRVGSSDIYDDGDVGAKLLHPYQTGYDKMAGVWYRALKNYYNGVPTLIAPDSAIANVTFPDTLAWGISSGVTNYTYQVSNSSSFGTFIYNTSTPNRYFILNDPTKFNSSTKYYWQVSDTSNSNVWNFTTSPLYVNATVFLQGPYDTTTQSMNTTLNSDGYIPLNQPYNKPPWNYGGLEQVSSNFFSNHSSIVDWVLIELRSNTTTVVKQRAAFLKSDGSVVDTDGVSPVRFDDIPFGSYYIVVEHRNHLAVMSNVVSNLTTNTLNFDFTNGSAYGSGEANLGSGYYGMIAGNAYNSDGVINAGDRNQVFNDLGSVKYQISDVNLDGVVNAADRLETYNNVGRVSNVP